VPHPCGFQGCGIQFSFNPDVSIPIGLAISFLKRVATKNRTLHKIREECGTRANRNLNY